MRMETRQQAVGRHGTGRVRGQAHKAVTGWPRWRWEAQWGASQSQGVGVGGKRGSWAPGLGISEVLNQVRASPACSTHPWKLVGVAGLGWRDNLGAAGPCGCWHYLPKASSQGREGGGHQAKPYRLSQSCGCVARPDLFSWKGVRSQRLEGHAQRSRASPGQGRRRGDTVQAPGPGGIFHPLSPICHELASSRGHSCYIVSARGPTASGSHTGPALHCLAREGALGRPLGRRRRVGEVGGSTESSLHLLSMPEPHPPSMLPVGKLRPGEAFH